MFRTQLPIQARIHFELTAKSRISDASSIAETICRLKNAFPEDYEGITKPCARNFVTIEP